MARDPDGLSSITAILRCRVRWGYWLAVEAPVTSSRDQKMNRDILGVDRHTTVPVCRKRTPEQSLSGGSTIQVSGLLTLLGNSRDPTIPMQIYCTGSKVAAEGQFVVPYVRWGLKNPSFLIWKAGIEVATTRNLIGQIFN